MYEVSSTKCYYHMVGGEAHCLRFTLHHQKTRIHLQLTPTGWGQLMSHHMVVDLAEAENLMVPDPDFR